MCSTSAQRLQLLTASGTEKVCAYDGASLETFYGYQWKTRHISVGERRNGKLWLLYGGMENRFGDNSEDRGC